jgi:hypothetical protein
MKYTLQIFVIFLAISLSVTYAQKDFGIGIILGDPTGVSAKVYTGSENAFDFAAAWSFEGKGHLLFQADYLFDHNSHLILVRNRLYFFQKSGPRILHPICH